MDVLALVRAGRHAEVIAALEPRSQAGDGNASNDLAVVYRLIGDPRSELAYAMLAYQQAPNSRAALNTLFRALYFAGQFRMLADVYAAHVAPTRLNRHHHVLGARALIGVNRLDSARQALARAPDFPRLTIADIEVEYMLASALSDHGQAFVHLDRLEAAGQNVQARRISQHFAAGDLAAALAIFEAHRETSPEVAAMTKTALLCAITLGDRARIRSLNVGMPSGVQQLAVDYLADAQEVEIGGRARTYRFPFGPENLSISLQHARGRFYEEVALGNLRPLLTPGDLVLDVGANVGNHTVYFAGEAGCRVIPFECNPRLLPRLRAAVTLAGLEDLVDLSHLGSAISDTVGAAHFNFIRDDFSNLSRAATDDTREVPAITLDSVAVDSCRLLKIDVDGGERPVLAGARQLLTTHRPIVAIEVLNFNMTHVLELFSSLDYDIYREDSRPEAYSDIVFTPREMSVPEY